MVGRGRQLGPPGVARTDSPMTSSCTCMKLSASSWRVLWDRSGTGRKPYTSLLQTYIWTSGAKETTMRAEYRAIRPRRQPPSSSISLTARRGAGASTGPAVPSNWQRPPQHSIWELGSEEAMPDEKTKKTPELSTSTLHRCRLP